MPKRSPEFYQQQLAEGSIAERNMMREERERLVTPLVRGLPTRQPDRTMYLRELVVKVMKNEIDLDVFKLFAKRTNTHVELESLAPRGRAIVGRSIDGRRA